MTAKATQSLEARIERLESESAIQRLVGLYALGADRRNDPEILGPLFAETAVWEAIGFGRYEGRAVIAAGLSDIAQQAVVWSIHYMVSPIIDFAPDGQSARCRWYLWELSTLAEEGDAKDTWLGGWYDTTVARDSDGAWRFTDVLLDLRLMSPADAPWQNKKPFDPANKFGQL